MKKIFSIILTTCVLALTGCSEEFFNINQSPNSAIEENMTPSLILPRALHRTASESAINNDEYLRWMGYWSRCSGNYGPNVDEEAYLLSSSFRRTSYLNWYNILKDFDVIEKNARTRNETAYLAIAKIMKTIGFMQLVDQYNNVPYSKAFDLGNNMLTPYDKGEAIYKDMILQLDSADRLLKAADVNANLDIKTADIMFKGDLAKWRKFGNTQRLRLILHQSELLGNAGLKTEIDKIVANGGGFLGAGETAEVQPTYSKDLGKQNPYWNTFNINDAGGLDNFNRANTYFLNLLKSNNDIRYQYFYSKATTPKTTGEDYYGYVYGFDYPSGTPEASKYNAANSSNVAGPGIAKSPIMAQWLLPSFESLFMQAEAIQRGALTGDAKVAYEAAVKESYVWLGVTDAVTEATNYLNSATKPFAVWDQNTDKLKLIMTQKYIAMFGINGLETWTDFRRVGFPAQADILSVSPSRGNNVIPSRLIYPLEEYQYNSANVLLEGTINPQTMKIFWDK